MTLIVYFVTLLWDFSPNGKPKKNTITLQQKKQNDYLCSKMAVALRAAGRPNAF